jgi:hypothetical protein
MTLWNYEYYDGDEGKILITAGDMMFSHREVARG